MNNANTNTNTKFTAQSLAALAARIGYTAKNHEIFSALICFAARFPAGATCNEIIDEAFQAEHQADCYNYGVLLADILLYCYHNKSEVAEAFIEYARNHTYLQSFAENDYCNENYSHTANDNVLGVYVTGDRCDVAANNTLIINTGQANNIAVNTRNGRALIISTGSTADISVNGNDAIISATGEFSTVSCVGRINSFILGEHSQICVLSPGRKPVVAETGENGIKANTWYFVSDRGEIVDLFQAIADRTDDAEKWLFMQHELIL